MALNHLAISGFGERKACVQILANSQHPLLVGTVLLPYDGLLTLSEEVTYIWNKKWKLGTVLYLLTRYPTLLYILTQVITVSLNMSLQVRFFHSLMHIYDMQEL